MEVINLLKELIQIDSRNPFEIDKIGDEFILEGNETKISEFIKEKLIKYNFKVKEQLVHLDKNGNKFYNILAEKGIGDSSILFYAHMDTVSSNPWMSKKEALTPQNSKIYFQGKERDVIVGLGSNDMKSGVAIILESFKDINPVDHKIKLCFGVDEEFYSLGVNKLVKTDFMNDVKAVVVPEIGDGPNNIYGGGSIGIGRLGRCVFKINVFGTGGHGSISMDKSFINASIEASKIIVKLEKLRKNYKDVFKFFNSSVPDEKAINEISGSYFVNRVDCGDGSLSIPSKGEVSVDCTFTPNMSIEKLRRMFEDIIDGLYLDGTLSKVEINGKMKKCTVELAERPTPFGEGYLTSENHPFTHFVRKQVENTVEFRNFNMGYSVADENIFKKFRPDIPVIVLGPVGWNSHRANEWVEIESVLNLVKIYRDIGKNFMELFQQ